jgi:hypothetical protein
MKGEKGVTGVICTYRVKEGEEEHFVDLLRTHWPTLHKLGLATDEPAQVFRGKDESGKTYFVELFHWKDEKAPEIAHQHPGVMAVWEPMGMLVEARLGRPPMEFPHVERLNLNDGQV